MAKAPKEFRFDKRASRYDAVEGRIAGRFYRLLLSQVALFEGANVLDIGCGTGEILRRMAGLCAINGYGIDMEENMISVAKEKCPDMNIQVARCEATPFATDTFDVLTTCMAYHHFADKDAFGAEAARILRPGGRLYIADVRFPTVIAAAINGLARLFRVAASFETPEAVYAKLRPYGFEPDGFTRDGYAQVVVLRRA